MQKKNLFLGLGAIVLATSTLFGVVACDDDEDDGGTTDEPTATEPADGGTTPSDGETTPMEEEPTATTAA